MERENRPNGMSVPEESGLTGFIIRNPDGTVRIIPKQDEDIRVQLSDIRKEIEETNRTLKRIAEGLERGRR